MKDFLNKVFYRDKSLNIQSTKDEIVFWESANYNQNKLNKEIPKIIWSFWFEIDYPKSIEICIKSWKFHHPNYQIKLLNKTNILEYLPDFNFSEFENLNHANLSDIIRLKLLYHYGGIWLDSSVFLNDKLDDYFLKFYKNNLDLLCFEGLNHNNKLLPITESWFLVTYKNNQLIKAWLDLLTTCFIDIDYQNFFKKKYNKEYLMIEEKNRDYLYIYMSSLVILKDIENMKIGLLNSRLNGLFYNYKFNYNYEKIGKYFLLNNTYFTFPNIIKLTSKNRNAIDNLLIRNLVRKNSMFGKYLA